MLRFHHVDLEALAPWIDRLDAIDVDLCGLLQNVDASSPFVREWMKGDFFPLTASYIEERLPWIRLDKSQLLQIISHLVSIGLWEHLELDCEAQFLNFSKRYWARIARAEV